MPELGAPKRLPRIRPRSPSLVRIDQFHGRGPCRSESRVGGLFVMLGPVREEAAPLLGRAHEQSLLMHRPLRPAGALGARAGPRRARCRARAHDRRRRHAGASRRGARGASRSRHRPRAWPRHTRAAAPRRRRDRRGRPARTARPHGSLVDAGRTVDPERDPHRPTRRGQQFGDWTGRRPRWSAEPCAQARAGSRWAPSLRRGTRVSRTVGVVADAHRGRRDAVRVAVASYTPSAHMGRGVSPRRADPWDLRRRAAPFR